MAWSSEFKEKLDVGGSPMFALDFEAASATGGFAGYSPDLYVLHSHGVSVAENHIPHALESFSGGGQSVSVGSWSSRAGGLRVKLASVEVASLIARKIPRGMPCRLMMGFAGWEYSRWQSLGVYQYENVSGKRNDWKITLGDGMKFLQSTRAAIGDGSSEIFGTGSSTVLVSAFPGFYIPATGGTLTLASKVGFTKGSTGRGLLKFEMDHEDDPDESPFFMKYSAIGVTPTFTMALTDVMGTTRASAVKSGSTVTHYNYIFEDLPRVIQNFMLDDVELLGGMPDGYNMGLRFNATHFDTIDFDRWKDRWYEYEDFHIDLYTEKVIANPARYISDLMAKFGAWLVFKEGLLSFRFVQNILESGTDTPMFVDYEITDQDIVSIEKYQAYNSDTKIHSTYVAWGLAPPGPSDYYDAVTLPALSDSKPRTEGLFFDDDIETTNDAGAVTHLRARLDPWYTRVPDELTLNLRGWRWAEMVPGDCVEVSSDYVLDIMGEKPGGAVPTLNGDVFMLTAINPNWNDFTTSVELTRLPRRHNPYI